ncbi:MAG: tyrosine-type recombinase/integrase, partial [Bacteroidia bacterium]
AYKNDLLEFQNFVLQRYEIEKPEEIKSEIIRSWVSELIGKSLEPVSVRRKVSTLRSFFKYLQKEKILDFNPVSNIPQLKIPKKIPIVINSESMDSILDGLPIDATYLEQLDYIIICILYGTGIRRAELIGLTETNIDLSQRQIKVLGKRSKERVVPITSELAEQIFNFMEIKKKIGVISNLLLVTKKNKILYPGYIYNVVKKTLTLHKVNGKRSPHILRHTYATRLLQNGAELLSVKELLGHSSLASTQVYTHVNIEDLKKIYKKNHPKQ